MKFEQFLYDTTAHQSLRTASVICLQATEYPLIFCRSFIMFLEKSLAISITSHHMDTENNAAVMASLQTTFLGQSLWYWLHADTDLAKKTYEEWHDFLRSYKGPNTLIFCTTQRITRVPGAWQLIQLPDMVDARIFKVLEHMHLIKQSTFSDHLFKRVKMIPLDTATMLCSYATLLGKNNQSFFDRWLAYLIVPDLSLFSLSQALFDRKASQFFMQWQQLAPLYSAQFWISFWSEQFWRAACYIRLQHEEKKMEAKKIGYRLPFSFLNHGWRKYSVAELQQAHQLVYAIDYQLKQGGSEHSLELLYGRFLTKSL